MTPKDTKDDDEDDADTTNDKSNKSCSKRIRYRSRPNLALMLTPRREQVLRSEQERKQVLSGADCSVARGVKGQRSQHFDCRCLQMRRQTFLMSGQELNTSIKRVCKEREREKKRDR